MKVPDTLPWEHDSDAGFIRSGDTVICQFWNKTENDFGNEDINAEYIVHACNNYPKLKEERDELISMIEDLREEIWGSGIGKAQTDRVIKEIDILLEKVKS